MQKEMFTDAIALLKADHRKVEGLFDKYEKATSLARKEALAHDICNELKMHAMIEEELFYPAMRGTVEDHMMDEAYVEHDGAKLLINELEAGSPDDDFYDAKMKVLSEDIKHHVHEEEMPTKGIFAQCRRANIDLIALRDAMMARKKELMMQAKDMGLPPAHMTTMTEAIPPQASMH